MNRRKALQVLAGGVCGVGATAAGVADNSTTEPVTATNHPRDNAPGPLTQGGLEFWLTTTLNRVYPTSTAAETAGVSGQPFRLRSGRNYRLSFQACVRNTQNSSAQLKCEIPSIHGAQFTIRRVGFVPMQQLNTYTPAAEQDGIGKIPGLCPDPLFEENTAHIGPYATAAFWISVTIPVSTAAGVLRGEITLSLLNRFGYMGWDNPKTFSVELPFEIEVCDVLLKPRTDFPVTLWLSADSIWEYYKIEPFSAQFWELAEAYIRNLVEHGVDVVYTPIFNIRAEKLKRPAQLLKVWKTADDRYEFDFSDVRRWIQIAIKSGAQYVEFSHLFSPAPESAAYPQKIYERRDAIGDLLWPANTPATSDTYRAFLSQFLPKFKTLLEEEGVLEKSLFHLADEPDGKDAVDRYRKARALLKELAPWIKVMDAMSDPHFATERLSDMPIPSITTANAFTAAGCPAWVYYCCGPRDGYIQRLLDTPLWKIRMSGWLFYRLKARGFLHWGYNYWFKFCTDQIADPFQDATNGAWPGMPYGDTFAVYPGPYGPIDSIRWEVFAESLQDYALLQAAGVPADSPMLSDLMDYHIFPKRQEWVDEMTARLLSSTPA